MPLTPGTRLGPYEIAALIGVGGMGEVYRATDIKLKREVAVKVLPQSLAADPDRLARFQREAEVLASLNHPNIAAIYGLEDAPSAGSGQAAIKALVMELVVGPTLAEHIARRAGPSGPAGLPLEEALPIARQMAEAFEAAHERGIIHRDLKPANVKVRPDGMVKVLDFGLAKAMEQSKGEGGGGKGDLALSQAPTITTPAMMTGAGVILGTAAYMSPEQARGKAVDKRADIWAFGCVLYEMLTGRRAFPGDDMSEVFASILAREPDWNALPASTPVRLIDLVRRCLKKDSRQRLRDIGDARLDIEAALTEPASAQTADRPARRRTVPVVAATWALIGLLLGGMAVGLVVSTLAPTAEGPRRLARFAIFPDDVPPGSLFNDIAITPDGGQIIYMVDGPGTLQLHARAVDQIAGRALGGTDGATEGIVLSPRGDQIVFFAANEMKVAPVGGGASTTVSPVQGDIAGASWAGNDTIVFAQAGAQRPGLLRVAASGGTPDLVASPDPQKNEREYRYPHVLPDGESVMFTILPLKGGIADARIAVRSLRTGDQKDLFEGGTDAVYLPTGYLVFGRSGGLAALPFDVEALEVRGRPLPVVDDVVITGVGNAAFSVSADGTLVYLPGTSDPPRRLIRVTRDGKQIEPVVSEALAGARYPRFSPTDGRLAVTIGASFAGDVWVHDLDRVRQPNKLTFDGHDIMPIWSPDGKTIVFQSNRSGPRSLFSIPADGSVVQPQPLLPSDKVPEPWDWSPDGRALIFSEVHPETRSDLWVLPITGERKPRPWLNTSFEETDARFSPDGRLIAYVTDQSGGREVWVRYVDASAPIRVSSGGGHEPVWARDGRELFYQSGARLMAVPVLQTSPDVRFGPARVVLDGGFFASSRFTPRTYDVGPDGRLLMIQPLGEAPRPSFVLVQNWIEELKRLVPVN